MVMKSYFKKFINKFCKHKAQTTVNVDIKGGLPYITCVCNKCEKEIYYTPHELSSARKIKKHKIEISSKMSKQIDKVWDDIFRGDKWKR